MKATLTQACKLALLVLQAAVLGAAQPVAPNFNCSTQPAGAFRSYTLKNGKGLQATFIPYGGTLTHLLVPDKDGVARDVILGWDDATQYCANSEHTYFGATIGRIANRITGGKFVLDGKTYHTPLNEKGFDTLHGGWVGYDRRVWTVAKQSTASITFHLFSPDGEMGFPGNVHIDVTHTLTADGGWELQYEATTDMDTVIAMTNHAYFNLNANVANTPTVLEHVLSMPTGSSFVEVDPVHLLPTGKIGSVDDAAFLDFRSPKALGKDINKGDVTPQGGYDNAWIFAGWRPGMPPKEVLTLRSPLTGIALTMATNQPSVQVYTGNFLNGTNANATDPAHRLQRKKSQSFGPTPQYYHWRGAATLETQHYPDAQNHPSFPSTVLKKGAVYRHHTKYSFAAHH